MRAMSLESIAPLSERPEPLRLIECDPPEPGPDEVRLAVQACGVCHTELDEIEGRTPPPHLPVIPGHQVVGVLDARGRSAHRHPEGARLGVGWIFRGDGSKHENVNPGFVATGRDVDGGYAEFMVVPEDYAFPIPGRFDAVHAAPLLCAGAIGHRALELTGVANGDRLGLMGFGGSAHLVLQHARERFPDLDVHVFARRAEVREFALALGARSAGPPDVPPPAPLDAVIDTTPAWRPVLDSLAALRPGGRLVINAIRKQDDDKHCLAELSYERHLWLERELKTVANITGPDIAEFLREVGATSLEPEVRIWPLEQANAALRALAAGGGRGAHVLDIAGR